MRYGSLPDCSVTPRGNHSLADGIPLLHYSDEIVQAFHLLPFYPPA